MPVRMRGHKILLTHVPSGGIIKSVKLTVDVEPALGAVLIYGAPTYTTPTRVNGPHNIVELETTEPLIFVQLVGGAQTASLGMLSVDDDLGNSYRLNGPPLITHKVSGRGDDAELG